MRFLFIFKKMPNNDLMPQQGEKEKHNKSKKQNYERKKEKEKGGQ